MVSLCMGAGCSQGQKKPSSGDFQGSAVSSLWFCEWIRRSLGWRSVIASSTVRQKELRCPPSFNLKQGTKYSLFKPSSVQGGEGYKWTGVKHCGNGSDKSQEARVKPWVKLGWRWAMRRTTALDDIRPWLIASSPNDEIVRNVMEIQAFP